MWIGDLTLRLRNWIAEVAVADGPFGNHATLSDDLVSYWALDEASGTRADSVGSNDLTDNNTVGFSAVAGPPNFPGGKAASFVAANSEYLSVADNATFNFAAGGQGFTINFWAKVTTGTAPALSKDNGTTERCWILLSGNWYVLQNDSTFSQATVLTPDTNWHMYTLYFDPADNKAKASVDNGGVTSGAAITGMQDQNQPVWIGRSLTTYHNGEIAEVAVWSRVLTAQERTDLWNSGAGLFYGD